MAAPTAGQTIESSGSGTLSFDNTVPLSYGTTGQARTLTLGGTNTGANTFAKVIANNGTGLTSLTKVGAATWILSGTNTFTGTTTVNAGILDFQNPGTGLTQTLGALTLSGPDVTLESDYNSGSGTLSTTFGTLAARGSGSTANFLTTSVNGTNNLIKLGQAAGFIDRGVFFDGADYAAMSATNGFVRALAYGTDPNAAAVNTITAGNYVKLTASQSGLASFNLLTLTLSGSGVNYTQSASQTLTVPGILKSGGGSGLISGGTAVTTTSGAELVVRTDTASDMLEINTPVTGTGGLTKSGAGTLLLSGLSSYSGTTTVNAGTLNITNRTAAVASITVQGGGTLGIDSGTSISTGSTFILGLASGISTVNQAGGNLTFTGGTQLIVGNNATSLAGGGSIGGGDGVYNLSAGTLTTAGVGEPRDHPRREQRQDRHLQSQRHWRPGHGRRRDVGTRPIGEHSFHRYYGHLQSDWRQRHDRRASDGGKYYQLCHGQWLCHSQFVRRRLHVHRHRQFHRAFGRR